MLTCLSSILLTPASKSTILKKHQLFRGPEKRSSWQVNHPCILFWVNHPCRLFPTRPILPFQAFIKNFLPKASRTRVSVNGVKVHADWWGLFLGGPIGLRAADGWSLSFPIPTLLLGTNTSSGALSPRSRSCYFIHSWGIQTHEQLCPELIAKT